MIANYMAIGPVHAGALRATKVIIGGDNELNFFKYFGLNYYGSNQTAINGPISYFLMPN
jgi:hypothetical protein